MDRHRPALIEPDQAGRPVRRRPAATPWVAAGLLVVPVTFIGVLFVWPLLAILGEGLRPDGRWDLDAFGDVLGSPHQRRVIWFTTWQAAVSTALALVIGLPGAWAFSRLRWRGRDTAWALLVIPFVLPTVVVGVAISQVAGPDGPIGEMASALGLDGGEPLRVRGTRWGVILAHVFFNVAVVIRTVGLAWGRLDPRLEEAGAVLGAGRIAVARRVTLPLLAPSIVAAASIVYLFCFTSFGVVLVLGASRVRTIEVEIYERSRSLDLGGGAVLAIVQLLVVVLLLAVAAGVQRRWSRALVHRDLATTARSPRGGERFALVGVLAALAVLLALPPLTLVIRSLRTSEGWGLAYYRALGTIHEGSVLFVPPTDALVTSVTTALAATLVALLVGGLASVGLVGLERHAARRRSQRSAAASSAPDGAAGSPRRPTAASAVDALLMLPLGTSAVTIGFGFVVAMRSGPVDLRGSWWLVPAVQALVAVPFVIRTLLPALRSIDPRMRESARVLGASPSRVWWEVEAPLMARPLAGAAAFCMAVSLGEFGATVFVARSLNPTLPLVVERLLGQPGQINAGAAMAAATLLMVLTVAAALAVDLPGRIRGGRR